MNALHQVAEDHDLQLFLAATPGRFLHPNLPALWVTGAEGIDPTHSIPTAWPTR